MRGPVENSVTLAAIEFHRIVVKRLVDQARAVLVEDADPQVDPVLQDRRVRFRRVPACGSECEPARALPLKARSTSASGWQLSVAQLSIAAIESSPTSSPRSAPTVVRKLSSAVARCWHAS